MATYEQKELFVRREKPIGYELETTENLKLHSQYIKVKFLEENGSLPARSSVQIQTTELTHPISFRFSLPSDMEQFLLAFLKAYVELCVRKIPNKGFRFLKFEYFLQQIREVLVV